MDKILIVDASPLIYAVYDTQGHLATTTGIPTGLRYGFLRSVRSYQERTKTEKVVIAFDTKGPVAKADGLDHYKANRTFTEEKADMYSQVPALREMLALTKWTQIDAPGFEADDIIGALARAKAARGDQITIVSPDNDLCQLLSDRIRVWRPASKRNGTKDHYVDEHLVRQNYGVCPEHLCVFRAITGDASDNLPGPLKGEANRKQLAEAMSRTFNRDVPLTLDRLEAEPSEGTNWNKLPFSEEEWAQVRANYKAMSLHRPPAEALNVTKGKRDKEGLTKLFESLEFKSMMKYVDELTGGTA